MARAARAMETATKRVMATNRDNTGNGYGEEGDGRLLAATIRTAQRDTSAGATTGERGMMVATGHGLCVCFGVCGETTKNKEESKIVNVP
jgi:hypothetical protein